MQKSPTRNVLILAFAFPPENLPGAARPYRFYRYLPEFGIQPYVVTGSAQDPEDPQPNVTPVIDVTESTPPRSRRRILQALIRKTVSPGEIGPLWTYDAIQVAGQLIRSAPIHAIYSTFPPLNVHVAAMVLARRYGLPWVADFRDPLVGNPFHAGRRLSKWFFRTVEKRIFERAQALTIVTDRMLEDWHERHPRHVSKTHVLWNGFDPDKPCRPLSVPARTYRTLAHIGSFYGGRTPNIVLTSLRRLIDGGRLDASKLRLRFVGDYGSEFFTPEQRTIFDSLAQEGVLEYEERFVPREEALRVMGESDYLYLADNSSSQIGYTVPAKLFEYVQVGRPILATTTTGSPVDRILKQSGLAVVTIDTSLPDQEIDDRLSRFLNLPPDPVKPSAWFQENFDGRRQAGTLAGILDRIISEASEQRNRRNH